MPKASKLVALVLSLLAGANSQHWLKTKCPSKFYLCLDYLTFVFPMQRENDKARRVKSALYFQFSVLFRSRLPRARVLYSCGPRRGRSEGLNVSNGSA